MATSEPKVTYIECPQCKQTAVYKVYTVFVPAQPSTIISSISCDSCGLNDRFIDEDQDKATNEQRIVIKGHFKSKEDLNRYVYLPENSNISMFRNNKKIIEYSSKNTNFWVIEAVIEEAIKSVSQVFNVSTQQQNFAIVPQISPSLTIPNQDNMQDAASIASSVDSNHEEMRDITNQDATEAIKELQIIRTTGICEIRITDNTGNARLFPKSYNNQILTYKNSFVSDVNSAKTSTSSNKNSQDSNKPSEKGESISNLSHFLSTKSIDEFNTDNVIHTLHPNN